MSDTVNREIEKLLRNKESKEEAFNLLVKSYSKQIYWINRRIVIHHDDANDVTQNAFIKIWQNIDSFRNESNIFSWIYRITINESLSFLKKKKSLMYMPILDIENYLCEGLYQNDYFDGDETELRLQKAILKLPKKQKIVFNMKYYDKLPYEEISNILGTSIGALKSSFHLAVKKIEKELNS